MGANNNHGGKRPGAGRKQKWSPDFKLHIGMLCQSRFREAQKRAEKLEIKKLTSQDSDLVDHWKIANNVPVPKRQAWRESEQGRYHFADIETELAILNEKRTTGSETNRLFQVKARPRRGTRKSILNQVAIEYSLTSNQVKYMWDEYMIFERNS